MRDAVPVSTAGRLDSNISSLERWSQNCCRTVLQPKCWKKLLSPRLNPGRGLVILPVRLRLVSARRSCWSWTLLPACLHCPLIDSSSPDRDIQRDSWWWISWRRCVCVWFSLLWQRWFALFPLLTSGFDTWLIRSPGPTSITWFRLRRFRRMCHYFMTHERIVFLFHFTSGSKNSIYVWYSLIDILNVVQRQNINIVRPTHPPAGRCAPVIRDRSAQPPWRSLDQDAEKKGSDQTWDSVLVVEQRTGSSFLQSTCVLSLRLRTSVSPRLWSRVLGSDW